MKTQQREAQPQPKNANSPQRLGQAKKDSSLETSVGTVLLTP